MVQVIFYIFAVLAVAAGLLVLLSRNVLYAALSLIVALLSVAAIYVFVVAEFVAVAQIMIYVGGVLVLMIFGIMLTRKIGETAEAGHYVNLVSGLLVSALFLVALIYAFFKTNFSVYTLAEATSKSTRLLGINLMTSSLVAFEAVAILLLVALIGAGAISGRKD